MKKYQWLDDKSKPASSKAGLVTFLVMKPKYTLCSLVAGNMLVSVVMGKKQPGGCLRIR